jgi:hypothetical protein
MTRAQHTAQHDEARSYHDAVHDAVETAPDGSPVPLYLRLRPAGESELISSVLRPGASVLELGCGPGRIG